RESRAVDQTAVARIGGKPAAASARYRATRAAVRSRATPRRDDSGGRRIESAGPVAALRGRERGATGQSGRRQRGGTEPRRGRGGATRHPGPAAGPRRCLRAGRFFVPAAAWRETAGD